LSRSLSSLPPLDLSHDSIADELGAVAFARYRVDPLGNAKGQAHHRRLHT